MLYHSIYSVRDKKKVNAEVIDIREIESAKGVRFQIVGRHPEDGTTVTTFCSATVAEDYKKKMSTLPHGLSAENIEVAQDHIPESEATVVSTDGTPVDDDLETFVEDPLVGSPSEGTLTSAKVLAAEGESEKKNCGCGQDPCKTYGAEGVSTTTLEDLPKDSLLNIIESVSTLTYLVDEDDVENYEGIEVESVGDFVQQFVDAANKNVSEAEDVSNAAESKEQSLIVNLDGGWSIGDPDDLGIYPLKGKAGEYIATSNNSFIEDNLGDIIKGLDEGKLDEWIAKTEGDDWEDEFSAETVAGIDVQTPSQIAIETPDSDELIVPDPDLLVNGDGRVLGQQSGKVNTTPMHAESEGVKVPAMVTLRAWEWLWCEGTPTWIGALNSDKPVKLVKDDFMELENADYFDLTEVYFGDQVDMEELEFRIKVTDQEMLDIINDEDYDASKSAEGDDYEYYEAPSLAGNKRVLIPTAVIGGLALAYLAKPELLSGSFDKISEMLGKMTKKGDKTE